MAEAPSRWDPFGKLEGVRKNVQGGFCEFTFNRRLR